MNAEWHSDSARRLICALALWGWGMTSSGLLLFGVVAYAQGVQPTLRAVLAMVLGSAGVAAWLVLSRLNARREPVAAINSE